MHYCFMSFSTPELSLPDMLRAAKRLGYDSIEPRMDAGHAHGIEIAASAGQRDALRKQAEDSGIALACLATSLKYADPAATDTVMEQTRERIQLAADLGIPLIRVFGGTLPEGLTRQEAIDQLVQSLGAGAHWADDAGVTLCIETHDDWTDPAHVAEVVGRVNHPGLAVNWDIMHPVRTGKATMQQAFETLKPWIRHLHVHDGRDKDGKLELLPIGQGHIDHRTAIECLKTIDYAGAISGEWINWSDPWEEHLPREVATMKSYERGE